MAIDRVKSAKAATINVMMPAKTTLLQGFLSAPSFARFLGKSPSRLIANTTRETPKRSESPSLKVVINAPPKTKATPTPLPTVIIIHSKGAWCAAITDAPKTATAVPATNKYNAVTPLNAIREALRDRSFRITHFFN